MWLNKVQIMKAVLSLLLQVTKTKLYLILKFRQTENRRVEGEEVCSGGVSVRDPDEEKERLLTAP